MINYDPNVSASRHPRPAVGRIKSLDDDDRDADYNDERVCIQMNSESFIFYNKCVRCGLLIRDGHLFTIYQTETSMRGYLK